MEIDLDPNNSVIKRLSCISKLITFVSFDTITYLYFQQQYKDIQASSMRTNTTVIPVHEDDEGMLLIE